MYFCQIDLRYKFLHEKQMAQNFTILKAFRIQAPQVTVLKDKSPLKQSATLLPRSKLFQGDKSTPKNVSHSTVTLVWLIKFVNEVWFLTSWECCCICPVCPPQGKAVPCKVRTGAHHQLYPEVWLCIFCKKNFATNPFCRRSTVCKSFCQTFGTRWHISSVYPERYRKMHKEWHMLNKQGTEKNKDYFRIIIFRVCVHDTTELSNSELTSKHSKGLRASKSGIIERIWNSLSWCQGLKFSLNFLSLHVIRDGYQENFIWETN